MVADFARAPARKSRARLVSRFTNDITVVGEAIVRGGQAMIRDTLTVVGAVGLDALVSIGC